VPESELGVHAGFTTEAASIQRSRDIEKLATEREGILRAGLTPDMVDRRSTPDLYRVRNAIRAGINWPESYRASELVKMYGGNLDWPLAINMVAYAWGTGEDARLVVLRPYWERGNRAGYRLKLRGIVLQDSPQQLAVVRKAVEAGRQEDIEWGVASEKTGIPWEARGGIHQRISLQDVELEDVTSVKGLTRALTVGEIKLSDRDTGKIIELPTDPLVFFRTSGRLRAESIVSSARSKVGV
jgi:hypothetical protein